MLMVAVGLLSYFVYAFTGSTERGNQNCEAEKKALRDDNLKKDQRIEVLTNAILYYRGVNVEMKKITDSVVRETVGNEAKKIVE